jgi:hypothetical protein
MERWECRSWPWSTRFSRYDTMINLWYTMVLYLNRFTSWTCQNFDRLVSNILDFGGLSAQNDSPKHFTLLKHAKIGSSVPRNRRGLSRTVTLRHHGSKLSALMAKLGIGGMSHRSFHWKSAISIHFADFCCTKKLTRLIGGPSPKFGFLRFNRSWSRRLQGDVRWTTKGDHP